MRYAYELKAWLDRCTPEQLGLPIFVDGYGSFDLSIRTKCIELDAVGNEPDDAEFEDGLLAAEAYEQEFGPPLEEHPSYPHSGLMNSGEY